MRVINIPGLDKLTTKPYFEKNVENQETTCDKSSNKLLSAFGSRGKKFLIRSSLIYYKG